MEDLNIEDVVALDPTDTTAFTDAHKTFLEEHKDELTTDELTKFGFEVPSVTPVIRTPDEEEDKSKKGKEDEGDDDFGDDDTEKEVNKLVDKKLDPILKRNQEIQDRTEIASFLGASPEFGKYKASIEAHVKDPNYRNIPIDRIAKMIAADDLMKIGARKEREAQRQADSTRNNSSSARKASGATKDWSTASREDMAAKRAEILGQGQ